MSKKTVAPIERVSIVESIANRLRARILSSDLPEGHQLRQEAIADEYAVSRMPVREALRLLEAQGLVVFHPHRGAVVSRLEPAEIEELFDLRILIEVDMIKRAASRASATDLKACEAALLASETAYDNDDIEDWGERNWAFHMAMYRPAGRDRSLTLAQTLNFNTDRYIRIQLSLGHSSIELAKREHRDLFEAYRQGQGDKAAELLTAHLRHACNDLIEALTAHRFQGRTKV